MRLLILTSMIVLLMACSQHQAPSDTSADASETDGVSVTQLELNVEPLNILEEGESISLKASALLSDGQKIENISREFQPSSSLSGTLKWFSDNEEVVSVSETGVLTTLKEGTSTVTARLFAESVSVDVVVTAPKTLLTKLEWHQSSFEKRNRHAVFLTLDANYSDDTFYKGISADDFRSLADCDLNFSSSDESVAIVTQGGELTPVSNGESVIQVSCGDFSDELVFTASQLPDVVADSTEVLESISIQQSISDERSVGETVTLLCDLTFNTGTITSVSRTFVTPGGNLGAVDWESSDTTAVQVANGRALLIAYGSSTITASFRSLSNSIDMPVKMATEVPDDSSDYFLNTGDVFTFTYGDNGGYGSTWLPDILHGSAWTGGTDVVSLGGGGRLLIELKDYALVDGVGLDFTLFENPQYLSGYNLFAERAQVSVSEDGVTFYSFACDADDTVNQVYEGCAGVNPVNALENPFDPSVSGGDSFDLADVGLSQAHYILIQDEDTCTTDDPSYPLCATSTTQGFDLDAMILLNGVND